MKRGHLPPLPVGCALTVLLGVLIVASAHVGSTGTYDFRTTLRGILALCGLAEPIPGSVQTIIEVRLWRTLVAVGVGGALAYSGALLQGVFRNGLASPAVLGITSGASLGAAIAILLVGGYGSTLFLEYASGLAPILVTTFGFIGALGVAALVTGIASTGGRVSVPTLLLVGIAVNVCLAGILAAIQSLVLVDKFEIAKAIFAWTFGNLTDRSPYQVGLIAAGVGLAALVMPFVAVELDLFAGGEEDAEALGVNTLRVKLLALSAAALAAASAVAAAGQIAFVGLVVPHLVRLLTGTSHRSLLPLSLIGGAVFLLGADLAQRLLLGSAALRPGVLMSLVGGPFFLLLLLTMRKEMRTW
ncbi:MAG: iron ABC transporter permease [Planctomycetota bacterium]|nr:MAG: iron ABC transporter permease [Planctomycetota bacterium]